MDSYEALKGQFNAAEAPQHRIHVIGMAEAMLANNPAVRQGLAEMSMQVQRVEQEVTDNVTSLDAYRESKQLNIAATAEKSEFVDLARRKAEDAYKHLEVKAS